MRKLSARNILNDNLETLQPPFNISQLHDKLCCLWRPGNKSCLWPHTPEVVRMLRDI